MAYFSVKYKGKGSVLLLGKEFKSQQSTHYVVFKLYHEDLS